MRDGLGQVVGELLAETRRSRTCTAPALRGEDAQVLLLKTRLHGIATSCPPAWRIPKSARLRGQPGFQSARAETTRLRRRCAATEADSGGRGWGCDAMRGPTTTSSSLHLDGLRFVWRYGRVLHSPQHVRQDMACQRCPSSWVEPSPPSLPLSRALAPSGASMTRVRRITIANPAAALYPIPQDRALNAPAAMIDNACHAATEDPYHGQRPPIPHRQA